MNEVKISVIIPTHNRPDKLSETLACLRSQDIPATAYEIIVVDDGSTPAVNLPEASEALDCRLVRLEKLGRSAARNSGAAAARGEQLVFVDDDMRVESDFLAMHLAAHREWPHALRVGEIHLSDEVRSTPFGKFRHNLEQHSVPRSRGLVAARNFCAAGNMSIARERFLSLGGFDKAIDSSEDQDFALRHTDCGGEIVFVPEACAIHCDSALDIQSYCLRSEWGMENMMPFFQRYPDWPDNVERERVNGPLRLGREPLTLSLKKAIKLGFTFKPVLETLFFIASILERIAPDSATLDRIYKTLLGAHLIRGYRKGMKQASINNASSINRQRTVEKLEAEI